MLTAVLLVALAAYFVGVPHNPPGFFVDESSIALNAYAISRGGADEHGARWPLFFRAFGEYKSPVYVYLLAALYRLTGPSVFVARALSAVAGAAAALLVGLVALRSARRLGAGARDEGGVRAGGGGGSVERNARAVGLAVAASALLTPWLFEVSRLVFEVALMPLALALFLLALEEASREGRWSWRDSARVALALALTTYAYSLGRLLAPLLALGLVLFAGRGGWWRVALRTWLFYGVAVLPILAFALLHPGALGARFEQVSYIKPETPWAEVVARFVRTYLGSFDPWM